jgi:heme A synthase
MSNMIRRLTALIFCAALCSDCFAWKKEAHFLSLPVIEGSGIYSCVRILQDATWSGTKASAITGLSLLGFEAGLGCFAVFGPQHNYPKLRRIHRLAGFALSASALWMSISAGNDAGVQNNDRNIVHGYALVTAVPLILFAF